MLSKPLSKLPLASLFLSHELVPPASPLNVSLAPRPLAPLFHQLVLLAAGLLPLSSTQLIPHSVVLGLLSLGLLLEVVQVRLELGVLFDEVCRSRVRGAGARARALLGSDELVLGGDELGDERVGSRQDAVRRCKRVETSVAFVSRHWIRSQRPHSQTQEQGESRQVRVPLSVKLLCMPVALGPRVPHPLVLLGRFSLLDRLDHSLHRVEEQDGDEDEGDLECVLQLGDDCQRSGV